ncbi:probable serine/threonine-protein kinase ireA isoform X2 [Xenia sp. Carnegie-2017]|uniref:probable serine/threonine-protein kinase ireA isoform X2 n=1 Tax=Xenia sp. Carnegie-2017 TaxID=2897299 RepID=UPI001F03AA1B|nr:probable serine/threonine-protein kinase ireA isoform X2 [Xenia sp. Carnegie-2017]
MSITVGNKEEFQKLVGDELEDVNSNFHDVFSKIHERLCQEESVKVRTATGTEGYLCDLMYSVFVEKHVILRNVIKIKSDESILQDDDAGVLVYFLDEKNNWQPFAYGIAKITENNEETRETYYVCLRLNIALKALGLQGGQFFKPRNNGDTLSVSDKHIDDDTALNNTNRDDNGRTASYKATYTYSSQLEIAEKTDNKILNLKLLVQMYTNEYHKFIGKSQKWNCVDKSVMHREKFEMMQKHWLEHPGDIRIKGDVRVIFKEKFLIGKGSGGTLVYLGLGNDGYGKAVKRILKYSYTYLALQEKNVLSEPNAKKSKHVVKYWNYVEEEGEDFVYLILELCEQTLTSFVESSSLDKLHEALPEILRQILNGLSDLHSGPSSLLHRDLKPSNVLQDVEGKFLIADFGISQILKSKSTHRSSPGKGTYGWSAPESLRGGRYKKESDIMSAGMVAYYVATKGEHAFGTEENILNNLLTGNLVGLKKIDDVQLKDLLSWMLQHEPKLRPSANEALKHPYLQSNEEKFDMLSKVGNQPELKQPEYQNSDVRKQLDCFTEWMKRIDDEVLKDFKTFEVNKNERNVTYESSWASCLRFIRNVDQHWHDKPHPRLSPYIKEDNYKEYFLQRFSELPLLVHKVIRSTDWKTRPDLKKHFTKSSSFSYTCLEEPRSSASTFKVEEKRKINLPSAESTSKFGELSSVSKEKILNSITSLSFKSPSKTDEPSTPNTVEFKKRFLTKDHKIKDSVHENLKNFLWLCGKYGTARPNDKMNYRHMYLEVDESKTEDVVKQEIDDKFKWKASDYIELRYVDPRKKIEIQELSKNFIVRRDDEPNETIGTLTLFCCKDEQHYALTCAHNGYLKSIPRDQRKFLYIRH